MANGLTLPQMPTIASLLSPMASFEANLAGILSQAGLPALPPGPMSLLSTLPDPFETLRGAVGGTAVRGGRTTAAPGETQITARGKVVQF